MKDRIDSYCDTVLALIASTHEMSWDEASGSLRTDVIHEHGLQQDGASNPVTPDVALLSGTHFGVVGDVKLSFPKKTKSRDRVRDQLLKYGGHDSVPGQLPLSSRSASHVSGVS